MGKLHEGQEEKNGKEAIEKVKMFKLRYQN